jgi:hypothetical protein
MSAPSLSLGGFDATKAAANFGGGIKKLTMYLKNANTARRYAICFEIARDLCDKFPMKAKLIWKAMADAWENRYSETE